MIDRLRTHYAGLERAIGTAQMSYSFTIDGDEHKQVQSYSIAARRPNSMAMRPAGEAGMEYAAVCDGVTLWQFIGGPFNKYEAKDAPPSFGELLDTTSFGQASDLESLCGGAPHLLVRLSTAP